MKIYLLLLAAGAVCLASCKKNNTHSSVTNPDGTAMMNFLQANAPKPQTFTIDASAGGRFTSIKGISYSIPAQAFMTKSGKLVTGAVNISVREITTPSEMFFSNRPTQTSNGQMMISYGEINVSVTQNNQPVIFNRQDSNDILVNIPDSVNGQGANLWSGDTLAVYTVSGYDYQNRLVSDSFLLPLDKGILWNSTPIGYSFFDSYNGTLDFPIDSLATWVNCDGIYSSESANTTLLGYFTNHYNYVTEVDYTGDQPTMLFFKPSGKNTLIKLYDVIMNAPVGYQGFLSYQNEMQIGLAGTFLAISTENGKFYADMKDTVVPAPVGNNNYSSLSFNPQEVTETQMVSLIQSLNTK